MSGRLARKLWKVVKGESQTEKYLKYIVTKEYNTHLQYWSTCRQLRGEVVNFMGHNVQMLSKINDEKKRLEEEARRFEILKNIFSLQNLKQLGTTDGNQREQLQRDLQSQLRSVLLADAESSTPPPSSSSSSSSSAPSSSNPTSTSSSSDTASSTSNPMQELEYEDTTEQGGVRSWAQEIKRRFSDEDDFETINIRFLQAKVEFEKEEIEFWSKLPVQQLREAFENQFPTHAFNLPLNNTTPIDAQTDTTKAVANDTTEKSGSTGIPNSLLQQLKERQALKSSGAPSESLPKIDMSSIPKEALEQLKQHKEKSNTKDEHEK